MKISFCVPPDCLTLRQFMAKIPKYIRSSSCTFGWLGNSQKELTKSRNGLFPRHWKFRGNSKFMAMPKLLCRILSWITKNPNVMDHRPQRIPSAVLGTLWARIEFSHHWNELHRWKNLAKKWSFRIAILGISKGEGTNHFSILVNSFWEFPAVFQVIQCATWGTKFWDFAMNWRNVRQSGGSQKEVFMFVYVLNNFLCPSEGSGSARNAPNGCHPTRVDENSNWQSLYR